MRARLSSAADCARAVPPPGTDLHTVLGGCTDAPAPVNKRFTDRLGVNYLEKVASPTPAPTLRASFVFVIQYDNGSERSRVCIISRSWPTSGDAMSRTPEFIEI